MDQGDRDFGGYRQSETPDFDHLISLRSWQRLGGRRSFQQGSDDATMAP